MKITFKDKPEIVRIKDITSGWFTANGDEVGLYFKTSTGEVFRVDQVASAPYNTQSEPSTTIAHYTPVSIEIIVRAKQ